MSGTPWYDTKWGRRGLWGAIAVTLVGVWASVQTPNLQIPVEIYLFGFLGAMVYVFTTLAKQFDRAERYRLKILCRTVAVLPLAAGVYMLAFAFPGVSGELNALEASVNAPANASTDSNPAVNEADRLVAGLVFLTGIYVSATLQALGGLADRLLGTGEREVTDSGDGADETNDGSDGR